MSGASPGRSSTRFHRYGRSAIIDNQEAPRLSPVLRFGPAAALTLVLALAPVTAGGQMPCIGDCPPAPPASEPWMSERTQGHLVLLGANAAIGGITAGVRQWRRGGSFGDGFLRGAMGGGVTYAGKVIVAREEPGAGLAGRGVAAVGSSITRNASTGRPSLERLILPVGPVRLHIDRAADAPPYLSWDAVGLLSTAGILLSRMDPQVAWGATLGTGAPVFHAEGWTRDWGWEARHLGGTIVLRGDGEPSETFMRRALAHERVHLLQYDQAFILWSDPAERRLLQRLGLPERLARRIDLSLHAPIGLGLNLLIPYELQPWEIEAHHVADTFDLHIH